MKIYTNEGNPLGLKLLILTKFAKKEVAVETVNLIDAKVKEPKHLPILELDSGTQFFSSSASAKYLFPKEEPSALRDEWLEWSTTRLAPALAHNMAVGHRADPNALMILNSLVKTLDLALQKTQFLIGSQLSSADISVWSLLAPDGTLKGAQDIDALLKWYRAIAALPEVKSALEILPVKSLHFTSLQQSNYYGGLHHVHLVPQVGDADLNILADSSNNIADTVTDEEMSLAKEYFVKQVIVARKEARTVLPKAGEKNVLITSALPYVNNVPHLGNIIGCVLSADIFARYSRLCGNNTLFVCGTDEYGTATETKALAENLTPQQICDKYFELHNSIYRWFGIGFDYFGRTTTTEQTEIVQDMFKQLYDAGFIETQMVEQLLCQKCERFLADRFVEGTCPHIGCGYEDARGDQCDKCGKLVNATDLIRPRCKQCGTAPVIRHSNQFFIDLPKIEPKLKEWIETVEMGWTHNARVITRAWLKEGLKSRCITRDLKWGIPVPMEGFENKVFYVWFDAPIGYMSITAKYTKEWREWWQPQDKNVKVDLYQFMAKDNVPFHSVMFPSTLLGVNKGYTLVSHIMATEYLNYEDGKFSKSRGVGVFGNDAQDTGIAADVWRFYLACSRPEGQDSYFSWNDLAARNNSELLNNLGNFVNRALMFCEKNFNSVIPVMNLTDEDLILLALINREVKGYMLSMEKAKFRDGIRHTLSISRHGNQYMQAQQPWVLLKGSDDEKARASTVIGICCNISCLLAGLLFPFMPDTSRTLCSQLNSEKGQFNVEKPHLTVLLPAGHKIGKPAPLFTKLETAKIEELKKKYAGQQQTTEAVKPAVLSSVAEAEKAIADQGEKVRALKASGAEKALVQPEVAILLNLKKQLVILQSAPKEAPSLAPSTKDLEDKITKQGEKVRILKASSEKSVWQPEVAILLDLKKQLTAAQSSAPAVVVPVASVPDANAVKVLEEKIAQQGEKVRLLKTGGIEKSVWQPEVEKLLALKKELTAIGGAPIPAPASKGKKKK